MKHSLTTEYAKNYSNWTHIIQVIVENVVTCFFSETQCINHLFALCFVLYGQLLVPLAFVSCGALSVLLFLMLFCL